jgi:hypothetical protein
MIIPERARSPLRGRGRPGACGTFPRAIAFFCADWAWERVRMDTGTAGRPLSTEHLASLRSVLAPLRQWLEQGHGRRGLRDGALGLAGVMLGLVAMVRFELSPLIAMLHMILAMGIDGLGARLSARHAEARAPRPFASPLQALEFADAVIAAVRAPLGATLTPRIAARHEPFGDVMPAATAAAPHARDAGRRPRLPPVRGFLIYAACVMALFATPLIQAAGTLFDRWDWIGLGALLAVNAVQLRSAWRDARVGPRDLPWDRDWSAAVLPYAHLMFWQHYRLVTLFASFLVALLLGVMAAAALSHTGGGTDFARTFEARLNAPVMLMFSASAVLHLMLLAAPWHARRRIAGLDAFDLAAAERQLQRVSRLTRPDQELRR